MRIILLASFSLLFATVAFGLVELTSSDSEKREPAKMSTDEPEESMLTLHTRDRQTNSQGEVEVVEQEVQWNPEQTAIIICDMWDDHWCQGAARRVAELAGPMNAMICTAREKGVFIIHAPSSVVDFYAETPQRQLAIGAPHAEPPIALSTEERWGTNWCWPVADREPEMPIDDSDMGCDCHEKCELREAWSRQIATLELHEGDALTDNGQEAFNLLEERNIENVILVGVHLNMCVLGRPFAIRQMVSVGKNVVLMRDMTDSMYNHEKAPFVNHFDGTDLVVDHVEQYWCPTITSSDITGASPFRFAEDDR